MLSGKWRPFCLSLKALTRMMGMNRQKDRFRLQQHPLAEEAGSWKLENPILKVAGISLVPYLHLAHLTK